MATDTRPGTRSLTSIGDDLAGFVESAEPGRYSGPDAAKVVSEFVRIGRLVEAGKTVFAKRAADANQHRCKGHRSPADWLASVTGESLGDAMEVLRLGDSLEDHPGIDDAFRAGKLSRGKAKLVSEAVRVNPGAEDELVEAAERDSYRQTRDRTQRAKTEGRSRQDDNAKYQALHRDRSCRTWTDTSTGAFRLDARLTPDAGAALLSSLRRESDRVFGDARRSGTQEAPDAYTADALVNLVTQGGTGTRGSSAGTRGSSAGTGDSSAGDRNKDGNKKPTRPRAHVLVRVDLDALRTGVIGPGGICEIPGVGPIPVDKALELMGDALCHLVITNGIDVTTICRMDRTIPAALQAALDERDATCVVPGCDVATGLEKDHNVAFSDHGPTALSNLAKLCPHHHYLKTHQGFTLAGGPGNWQWIPPTGDSDPPDTHDLAPNLSPGRRSKPPLRQSEDRSGDAPRLFPKRE